MVLSVYDFENNRHNMQVVTYSALKAYAFGNGVNYFSAPLSKIIGVVPDHVTKSSIIVDSIKDGPKFWIMILTITPLYFLGLIALLISKRSLVFNSIFRNRLTEEYNEVDMVCAPEDIPSKIKRGWRKRARIGYKIEDDLIIFESEYANVFFIATHMGAVFYIIVQSILMFGRFSNRIKFFSCIPYFESLMILSSHYETRIPKRVIRSIPNISRSFLPEGRYWLDKRNPPIYPSVHADKTVFCAYNPEDSICDNPISTPKPEPVEKLPNIVLLVYESLNPSTYLINDDFIDEHITLSEKDKEYYLTNTTYYNKDVMPGLTKLSQQGITFSGMNSLGMPTISGWHSLLSGVIPSQSFYNIIDGNPLHVDDLPSHLRDEGYFSTYITGQSLDFDGQENWVYRRSAREEAMIRLKCKQAESGILNDPIQIELTKESKKIDLKVCTDEEIQKEEKKLEYMAQFPQTFDYIQYYFPTNEQAKLLNLSADTLKYKEWTNDRISTKQIQLHYRQLREYLKRNKRNGPIFAMSIDVDAHMPYIGYDLERYYDPIDPTLKFTSDEHKIARFKRVNKYADKYYINETVEFLKRYDPNTIVIVTGDHATRDIPIRSKNSPVTDKAVFSGDCIGGSSGHDSFFDVSGMISYLGNDSRVIEALGFDKLAGKTLKIPCDHIDLAYTITDIIAKLHNTILMPTHKRGRNLIDIAKKVYEQSVEKSKLELESSTWESLSYLSGQIDFRKGMRYLRTHPNDVDGSHYYDTISFPTCLKPKYAPNREVGGVEAKKMYKEMLDFLNTEDYLITMNSEYHYNFRDMSCVMNRTCKFPIPKPNKVNNVSFWVGVFLYPICMMIICSSIVLPPFYIADYVLGKKEIKDGNTNALDFGSDIDEKLCC